MSRTHVPKALRTLVTDDAAHRCGYCLSTEAIVGSPFEMDHLIPESLGGRTVRENLWLCCAACNERKGSRTSAFDSETDQRVRLFHPRRDKWTQHFRWTADCELIEGQTPIGRATVLALELNRPLLVTARRAWVQVGWHPPADTRRKRRRPR